MRPRTEEISPGHDSTGHLAAEYGPPSTSGPQFLTADALGSTRLVTDGSGQLVRNYDYLPFGEELGQGNGGAARDATFSGTSLRQKFTGKERDAETGLDFFLARYYSAAQGRFTSPDEFVGGLIDLSTGQLAGLPGPLPYADITDPQTLNKYAYVRNNPLRYVDPDGHIIDTIADIGFILYDVYKLGTEGATRTNLTALGADAGAALIPFATGAGAAIRVGAKAEHVIEASVHAAEGVQRLEQSGKGCAGY